MSTVDPQGGAKAGDSGAPTINIRNVDDGPQEVPELKIRERPPSTLRNIDSGPREVPGLKIWERPPSTLRNIDGGPPRR
jgi:hypothetical protein